MMYSFSHRSLEGYVTEIFNPLLSRECVNVKWLSPYQIIKKREPCKRPVSKKVREEHFGGSSRVENYRTMNFTETSLSKYSTQIVGVNAHLLKYVVEKLNFTIIKVLALYSYEQKPFLREYMDYNRIRRKQCLENNDTIGANSAKLSMNGCFGGFGVNPTRPRIKVYQDYHEESEKFRENNKKENYMSNAWLVTEEQIKDAYNEKFKQEKVSLKKKKQLNLMSESEYQMAKEITRKDTMLKCTEHVKYMKSVHNRKNIDIKNNIKELQKKVRVKFCYKWSSTVCLMC